MTVCLIEDDLLLGKALTGVLTEAGYRVTWVRTVRDGRRWLGANEVSAAVIDLGLPDGNGIDVLVESRRTRPELPMVIITARDALQTRIDGLDAGADDFLVKPFANAELLARLRAVMRRAGLPNPAYPGDLLQIGDLVLDEARRLCTRGGSRIALSPTEFALLHDLLLNLNRVRTRRQLEASAMPESQGQSLDTHISNLRRKIGPDVVRTVRGIGYLIEAIES